MYDGFIFPDKRMRKVTGIDTKQSHGFALRVFLQMVNVIFNISETVDTVSKVYFQMRQKMYLYCDDPRRYTSFFCINQLDEGLQHAQQLCKQIR